MVGRPRAGQHKFKTDDVPEQSTCGPLMGSAAGWLFMFFATLNAILCAKP